MPNALLLSASFLKSEAQQLTNEPTLGNYGFLLTRPLYLEVLLRTFIVGVCVGAIDVVLGFPLAYFLVRTKSRWKGLLIALSLAPLLASVIVRTYGWYIILNRFGVVNDALLGLGRDRRSDRVHAEHRGDHHRPCARTAAVRGADDHGLARRHQSEPRAGRDEPRCESHAHVPERRAAAEPAGVSSGGFILVFSIAISAYATPAILGGPATQVAATAIYSFMINLLDWSIGAALAVILIVSSLLLLYAAARMGARRAAL